MSRLSPPFDRADMPPGVAALPVSPRGYPIPWFVNVHVPHRNGEPDFRAASLDHFKIALAERRCWVCGQLIRNGKYTFPAGPMCGVNRTTAEPPCHFACALWSARACPFLSRPNRIRDDRDLPESVMAGHGILRNPGVTMLWVTKSFRPYTPTFGGAGVLFEMGDPLAVHWLREGREATRAEVMESIETGLPLLLEECEKDVDPLASVNDLIHMASDFISKYVPPERAA